MKWKKAAGKEPQVDSQHLPKQPNNANITPADWIQEAARRFQVFHAFIASQVKVSEEKSWRQITMYQLKCARNPPLNVTTPHERLLRSKNRAPPFH